MSISFHTPNKKIWGNPNFVEYYTDSLFPLQHKNLCFDLYNYTKH